MARFVNAQVPEVVQPFWAALQRAQAAMATTTRELPVGHFPMLSRPDLVAACIEEIASAAS